VNHREFLGLISDADIYDLNNPDEAVGNHNLSLSKPYVREDQHIYEVIEVLSRLELTLVPVLDLEKQYLGVITQEELTQHFAHLSAMRQPGGIIELEMNEYDYSLSEISQIVESNNARILSLYVSSNGKRGKIRVTLKINLTDMTAVMETFNRYNYTVVSSHMNDDELDEFYQERFDVFLKYLNT
jgi:CBS domain-containing protein